MTFLIAEVLSTTAISQSTGISYLDSLITQADAIAAVEIPSTDYTATADAGPVFNP